MIIQGDCLEVLKTLASESVDCCITSPPYNKNSAKRKCSEKDSWQKANIDYILFKDNLPENIYQEQQKQIIAELVRIIKKEGSIFYNHKPRIKNHKVILPSVWLEDFNIRQVLIWDRGNTPSIEPIRWFPTTEYIYWITKTNIQPKFYKRSDKQCEVIKIAPKPMKDHPAPFPEELVETLMINTTDENDIVLDPFCGSGTTGVVCKKLKRKFIGIELNPEYIKIAEKRIKETIAQDELF